MSIIYQTKVLHRTSTCRRQPAFQATVTERLKHTEPVQNNRACIPGSQTACQTSPKNVKLKDLRVSPCPNIFHLLHVEETATPTVMPVSCPTRGSYSSDTLYTRYAVFHEETANLYGRQLEIYHNIQPAKIPTCRNLATY